MGCGPQETFRACSDIQILDTEDTEDTEDTAHSSSHTSKQKQINKDRKKRIKVIRKKVIGVKNFKPYLLSVITLNERKSNNLSRNTFEENAKNTEKIKALNQRHLHDFKIIDNLINTIWTCKAIGKS